MRQRQVCFNSDFTWHITEELLTEVPLCSSLVPVKVVLGPPGLLVTGEQ